MKLNSFNEKVKYRLQKFKGPTFWKVYIFFFLFVVFALIFNNNYEIQLLYNGFANILKSDLQVYCLDVGQASANFVVFPNRSTMMIDTGSTDSSAVLVEKVKTIISKNKLENEIDLLILTHSDADHVGGVPELMKSFQVNAVFRPKILSKNESVESQMKIVTTYTYANAIEAIYSEPNCNISFVENKQMFAGEVSIEIMSCQDKIYADTNAYSPYINLSFKNKTFFFTGDAPLEREEEFLNSDFSKNLKNSIDFLFVPHHGSKHSSSTEFLKRLKPIYAIISAGDSLHPSKEVIERLSQQNVNQILCTKNVGTIAVGVKGNGQIVVCDMSSFCDLPYIIVIFTCMLFILFNGHILSKKSVFMFFRRKRQIFIARKYKVFKKSLYNFKLVLK